MIGREGAPKWLETDWLLACFGKQRKKATGKYVDFVRAGAGLPPRHLGFITLLSAGQSSALRKCVIVRLDPSLPTLP